MNGKKYVLKITRTGKEWKSFTSGVDFLKDDVKYRLEWELNSLWDCFRGWWGIVKKLPHTYTNGE